MMLYSGLTLLKDQTPMKSSYQDFSMRDIGSTRKSLRVDEVKNNIIGIVKQVEI
jgi:hypothetical protein